MRSGQVVVVSSALLFFLGLAVPYPSSYGDTCGGQISTIQSQHVVISEFYPCGLCEDEYFVLTNLAYSTVDMDGWTVTDGEGSLTFVGGLALLPGGRLALSANSSSFAAAYGVPPDIGLDLASSYLLVARSGSLRLADDGDNLSLLDPSGALSDLVCYGDCLVPASGWTGGPVPALRQGEVCKRVSQDGLPRDTDCADDWQPFREHRYGYTDHPPIGSTVPQGQLVAFTSPDSSLEVVLGELARAEDDIRLCAYELYSSPVCNALLSAIGRGVDVSVLVDGSPVGGMDDREVVCLSALRDGGALVWEVKGAMDDDIVRHFGALHPKYAVIDGKRAVVMSENFVESGLPADRLHGNRGWGVAFTSSAVAGYLVHLFDEDSRASRPDVMDWGTDPRFVQDACLEAEDATDQASGVLRPLVTRSDAFVEVRVSPDHSQAAPYLAGLMGSSMDILAEQFQADALWKDRWTSEASVSPILSGIIDRLRANATVRVLLDSSWFNIERSQAAIDMLSEMASGYGSAGGFQLLDNRSPITVLHNKGLVLDGNVSIVSSNNWVRASFAENRELAVVIRSQEVASYFSDAFDLDWYPDETPPVADAGQDITVTMGSESVLDGSGSHDGTALVRWSWDWDSDGSVDCSGPVFEFVAVVPGMHTVTLTVEDCWGNTASDTVSVDVLCPYPDEAASEGGVRVPAGWLLAGGASALAPYLLLRRLRHRPMRPHKINLRRLD